MIKVTASLDTAVTVGIFPEVLTATPPRPNSDGMKPLDNRRIILQSLEAFKEFFD
jgi:hypothetical protein